MNNERTSKQVASETGKILRDIARLRKRLITAKGVTSRLHSDLYKIEADLGMIASVAASALTQAPDREGAPKK